MYVCMSVFMFVYIDIVHTIMYVCMHACFKYVRVTREMHRVSKHMYIHKTYKHKLWQCKPVRKALGQGASDEIMRLVFHEMRDQTQTVHVVGSYLPTRDSQVPSHLKPW